MEVTKSKLYINSNKYSTASMFYFFHLKMTEIKLNLNTITLKNTYKGNKGKHLNNIFAGYNRIVIFI